MCLLLLATASPTGSAPQVAPPDVHALVMLLQQELELVRYEMGKPRRLEGGGSTWFGQTKTGPN